MNEAQRRAIQNEKNKVVTTIPRSSTTGVTSYDWREGASAQERNVPRTADRAERVGSLVTTANPLLECKHCFCIQRCCTMPGTLQVP